MRVNKDSKKISKKRKFIKKLLQGNSKISPKKKLVV